MNILHEIMTAGLIALLAGVETAPGLGYESYRTRKIAGDER